MNELLDINGLSQTLNDPIQIISLLTIAVILGIVIAWTYFITYRGFSFSKNFTATLVILTVITTLIILVIGDNVARAIGLFGAFSIVRFRTAVKDVRDTAFMFFALAAGLAVGTASIALGVTGVLFISFLIFVLYKIDFGGPRKMDYVLNFDRFTDVDGCEEKVNAKLKKFFKIYNVLAIESKEKGRVLNYRYNVALRSGSNIDQLIKELSELEGLSGVRVVHSKSDLEY